MSSAEAAWTSYKTTLRTNRNDLPSASTMRVLHSAGRARSVTLWTLRHLLRHATTAIPPLLSIASHPSTLPDRVLALISAAHDYYTRALNCLNHLRSAFSSALHVTATAPRCFIHRLRAHLHATCLTPQFSLAVYRVFKAHISNGRLPTFERHLTHLGFTCVVNDALSWAVFERLDSLVANHISSPTVRAVPDLLNWVREFSSPSSSSSFSSSALWTKRLEFHLHESVCDARTHQLLQLIEQFPRSIPALHDLRDCFRCTDRKPFVAQELRRQFDGALLNAGTQTSDIIQRYVSTIRTLRFLDPTGVVLACVSDPIRAYLRRRPDTVRCIVSGMTGDGDLYEELQRGRGGETRRKSYDHTGDSDNSAHQLHRNDRKSNSILNSTTNGNNNNNDDDDDNEDNEDNDCQSIDGDVDIRGRVDAAEYDSWEPEPVDAPARDEGWWRRRGGDAIGTLVNIYGSSEQIVAEYRALLADKLVSQFDVDLEREEQILLLLTERFGKAAMHDCAIMLKDVRDSRVVLENDDEKENNNSNGDGNDNTNTNNDSGEVSFDATVVSREFWPDLADEGEFRPPQDMARRMQSFAHAFGRVRKARKLRWLHGLGACRVRLEFSDGRAVHAVVSPMQAAALDVFARVGRIGLTELAKELGVEDETVLRRKVVALANRGILRAVENGVYEPAEHGHISGDGTDIVNGELDDEDEDESVGGEGDPGEVKEEEEMQVYETYIIAMLTNLKQLSLEQIHTMLKRFMQTPVYDKTQAQLSKFLVDLVEKGKVEVAAGIYKVKKT